MPRIPTLSSIVAATLLLVCCLLPLACQAAQPPTPPRVTMQDVFYAWLENYSSISSGNHDGVLYLSHHAGENSMQYIQAIRRNLKKEGSVWRQSKQGVFDGVELPYVYIDEQHAFLRYMPHYSNKEVHERIIGGPGYKKLKDIELLLGSYYLKLLPLTSAAGAEYVLVLVLNYTDNGGENSLLYFFRVKAQQQGQKVRYHFSMTVIGALAAEGYDDLMDAFSVEDFRPALEKDSPHDEYFFSNIKCHMDKRSGGLLFFYDYAPGVALSYAWNGQRYVKKSLVKEGDWYEVWSRTRGQE